MFFLVLISCALFQEKWLYIDKVLEIENNDDAKLYLESKGKSIYQFGMDLINLRREPEQAIQWYTRFVKEKKDQDYLNSLFGRSWAYWINEEYHNALQDTIYLLSFKDLDPLIRTRCNYLVGLIQIFYREFNLAEQYLNKSIEIYKSLHLEGGVTMVTIELANAKIQLGNHLGGVSLLEKIKTKNSSFLGRISELYGEISFREARYETAIAYLDVAIKNYKKNLDPIPQFYALSKRGLNYALFYNFSKAYDDARKVDRFVVKYNEKTLFNYNNLTWIYLNKCRGLPTDHYTRELEIWSNASNDKELLGMKNMILNLPCP